MIKQFILQDFCLNCKGCCRFSRFNSSWAVSLFDEEIENLLKNNMPAAVISNNKKISLEPDTKDNNFICAFFNSQDNKCRIYAMRPFECQIYPFVINKKDNKVFLAIDPRCPYVCDKLDVQELKDYARYLYSFLSSKNNLNKLKNNPQVIQPYEEVVDLFELKIA